MREVYREEFDRMLKDFQQHEKSFSEFKDIFMEFKGGAEQRDKHLHDLILELVELNKEHRQADNEQSKELISLGGRLIVLETSKIETDRKLAAVQQANVVLKERIDEAIVEKNTMYKIAAALGTFAFLLATLLANPVGDFVKKMFGGE